jgi:hypothetical protein
MWTWPWVTSARQVPQTPPLQAKGKSGRIRGRQNRISRGPQPVEKCEPERREDQQPDDQFGKVLVEPFDQSHCGIHARLGRTQTGPRRVRSRQHGRLGG